MTDSLRKLAEQLVESVVNDVADESTAVPYGGVVDKVEKLLASHLQPQAPSEREQLLVKGLEAIRDDLACTCNDDTCQGYCINSMAKETLANYHAKSAPQAGSERKVIRCPECDTYIRADHCEDVTHELEAEAASKPEGTKNV